MKNKNPVPLSQIVCDVLPSFFSQSGFLIQLWEHWPKFSHSCVLQRAKPVSYKRGRLILWVEGNTALQELHFYTEDLKNKINTFFKKEHVQEICFTVNEVALQRYLRSVELMKKIGFKRPLKLS